jgi:hypothetical protein
MNNWYGNNYPNFNRPQTNKIVVNSLEEALSMFFDFNSNMVCWDRNKNLLYDIYVDGKGMKSYDIFEVTLKTVPESQENAYDKRLKAIESKLEELYGKHNAQSPDGTE